MSEEDREKEIEDLLAGRGSGPGPRGDAGERPGPAAAGGGGGELEDLLGRPGGSAGRPEGGADPVRPGNRSDRPERGGHEGEVAEEPAVSGEKIRLPFNYTALVGLVFVLIAVFALANLLRSEESGTVGIGDVGIGEKVAPFAVPIATSDLEGDANIDPDEACGVAGKDVLRICDYFDRPLVISFWFTGGASECVDQQDVFERVARRYEDRVAMVSINVRDDRGRVRDLIAERGWDVTVGHDTDGAVSNIYRVGGCPTFLFVEPGGVLRKAEIGRTTVEELSAQVRSFANGKEG